MIPLVTFGDWPLRMGASTMANGARAGSMGKVYTLAPPTWSTKEPGCRWANSPKQGGVVALVGTDLIVLKRPHLNSTFFLGGGALILLNEFRMLHEHQIFSWLHVFPSLTEHIAVDRQGAWEDGRRHGKGIQDALIETKGALPITPSNLEGFLPSADVFQGN